MSDIRVRMAPSPTGFLNMATARTTLFNWLFARHHGGQFILRIEDTDLERSEKRFEDDILEGLRWLGLEWDEFYRQTDRIPIYTKYIEKLLKSGRAFWCYHTKEELEQEQKFQLENKQPPRHLCEYKIHNGPPEQKNKKGIIRLAVNVNSDRKLRFNDLIRGQIEFEESLIGDISIAKNLETPLYNFAVVIDDYEMSISHVIRGEDHIGNTPKQILIAEALDISSPKFAHLPLILAPDRSKLSKRYGATGVSEYRKLGYLPEAIINFLGLLGFTPESEKEILSINELISMFDLDKVHKSGAVFDLKKLDWMNGEYIKMMGEHDFAECLQKQVLQDYGEIDRDYIFKMMYLVRERIKKFSDIEEFNYFFEEPSYEADLLIWKNKTQEEIKSTLSEINQKLDSFSWEPFDKKKMKELLEEIVKSKAGDRGSVYWPMRAALSGQKQSPDPIDLSYVLGKTKTRERIQKAIDKL